MENGALRGFPSMPIYEAWGSPSIDYHDNGNCDVMSFCPPGPAIGELRLGLSALRVCPVEVPGSAALWGERVLSFLGEINRVVAPRTLCLALRCCYRAPLPLL